MRTVICMILDESPSMAERGKDVAAISAYNQYVRKQQEETSDECLLALVKFDQTPKIAQALAPVADAQLINRENYKPGGSGTAIYDAVAFGIEAVEGGLSPDDRVIIVLLTDGEENSSTKHTQAGVKELITAREKTERWTFVYLSSSPFAHSAAASMGYSVGNVGQYQDDHVGVSSTINVMASNTKAYRSSNFTRSYCMAHGVGSGGGRSDDDALKDFMESMDKTIKVGGGGGGADGGAAGGTGTGQPVSTYGGGGGASSGE